MLEMSRLMPRSHSSRCIYQDPPRVDPRMDIFPQMAQQATQARSCALMACPLHCGACAHSSRTPSDTALCPQFLEHRMPTKVLVNRGRKTYARTPECGDRTEWGSAGHRSCPIPRLHRYRHPQASLPFPPKLPGAWLLSDPNPDTQWPRRQKVPIKISITAHLV